MAPTAEELGAGNTGGLNAHLRCPPPVIVVITLTATERIEDCMEAGADDFVGKPFQAVEFLIRVRAMPKMAHVFIHVERLEQSY